MANDRNRRLRVAACMLLVSMLVEPGFAQHLSRSTYQASKSQGFTGCTNHGLPCSTAPVVSGLRAKSDATSEQLTRIEKSSAATLKTAPGHTNRSPMTIHNTRHASGKQAPINFAYQAPRSRGRSTRSR